MKHDERTEDTCNQNLKEMTGKLNSNDMQT